MREKQAAASVGQCELMFIYDKFFSQYGSKIAQLLLTKTITENSILRDNAINTLETLFELAVIPIVNENDSIAVDEITYGDNDTLSAVTATLIHADLLILLSDIDGLYNDNPTSNPHASLIPIVTEIDEHMFSMELEASLEPAEWQQSYKPLKSLLMQGFPWLSQTEKSRRLFMIF